MPYIEIRVGNEEDGRADIHHEVGRRRKASSVEARPRASEAAGSRGSLHTETFGNEEVGTDG